MSIDWSSAPPEATHAAQDLSGSWCFYNGAPDAHFKRGLWVATGTSAYVGLGPDEGVCNPKWFQTLEERPPANDEYVMTAHAAIRSAWAMQSYELDRRRTDAPETRYADACGAMTAHLADMYRRYGVPDEHRDHVNAPSGSR